MNLFTALNALLLLAAPVNTEEVEFKPVDFRVQVYPYGGYYSYPPYCPPGYSYGYGRRGFSFYYGPGYGYGRRCYPSYGYGRRYNYGPRFYYRGGGKRHHGRRHHRRR
ncbi:MAG: hypothetical protein K1000chlam2_01046 [Chlamydiae bacterium]|nr:hypothetical protein [Chlamydiota bacterium]